MRSLRVALQRAGLAEQVVSTRQLAADYLLDPPIWIVDLIDAIAPVEIVAYHGRSGDEHEASARDLTSRGLRMISLCAYGDNESPLYAAVWARRRGPQWVHCYGLNWAEYQAFYDEWHPQGYEPVMISSAMWPSRKFAAVLEHSGSAGTVAQHNVDQGSYNERETWARAHGYLPKWISQSSHMDARIDAIWVPNVRHIDWVVVGPLPASKFQQLYEQQVAMGHGLAFVTVTAEKWFASIWHRNTPRLTATFKTRHNLTHDEFQAECTDLTARGWYPRLVQAAKTDETRFAAMFCR